MFSLSHEAYVAFGSNLGRRKTHIEKGIRLLSNIVGIQLHRVSPVFETEPVGGPQQAAFLNGVVKIQTHLTPLQLLRNLRKIEARLGRVRRVKWGPRILDLDLLTYDRLCLCTRSLTLPHPRYHLRRFVLVPLVSLAPRDVHPIINKTNQVILRELTVVGQRVTMRGRWKKSRFQFFKRRKLKKVRSLH